MPFSELYNLSSRRGPRAWLSWTCVGLLAALCILLAFLQNRWITDLSRAEQERLHSELAAKLTKLSRDFNYQLGAACLSLLPSPSAVDELGREKAYFAQYLKVREKYGRMFSRVAVAVPHDDRISLLMLDAAAGSFSPVNWPAEWQPVREHLNVRLRGGFPGPVQFSSVVDIPRLGDPAREQTQESTRLPEADWLLEEIDLNYIRSAMLPDLLRTYLGGDGKLQYDVEVIQRADSSRVIFRSSAQPNRIGPPADASITLFDTATPDFRPSEHGPPPRLLGEMPPPSGVSPGTPFSPPRDMGRSPLPPPGGNNGRWRILVRHQEPSLEAAVGRARKQNLALSSGILLLILATGVALLRFSHRAHELAQAHIAFVAGVSHELKTPLTVIRTAAFNLSDGSPEGSAKVERYGQLIQEHSRKLGDLIDQTLRFASSKAGHVIRERVPVSVTTVIEDALRASLSGTDNPSLSIEKKLDSDLPVILADEQALRHAIQNLIDNALKYGMRQENWLGIFASAIDGPGGRAAHIRIVDRGPGIAIHEQRRIFDPFFRGQLAIRNQIHGAGLGLNLVKKIVEAHGGVVHVASEPFRQTEFAIRIPAMRGAET